MTADHETLLIRFGNYSDRRRIRTFPTLTTVMKRLTMRTKRPETGSSDRLWETHVPQPSTHSISLTDESIFAARLRAHFPAEVLRTTANLEAVEIAFDQIPVESAEAGHEPPPEDVVNEARRIVREMFRRWPREYDVYPMDERRVAVEVDGGHARKMLLLCEPGGSALCIVTVNRISRRARYEDSSMLPDGFVSDALGDTGVHGHRGLAAFWESYIV